MSGKRTRSQGGTRLPGCQAARLGERDEMEAGTQPEVIACEGEGAGKGSGSGRQGGSEVLVSGIVGAAVYWYVGGHYEEGPRGIGGQSGTIRQLWERGSRYLKSYESKMVGAFRASSCLPRVTEISAPLLTYFRR